MLVVVFYELQLFHTDNLFCSSSPLKISGELLNPFMKYSTVKEMSLSTQLNKFATSKYIIHNNNITLILPHPGNMIKPCKSYLCYF